MNPNDRTTTHLDLDKLEALARAATRGPWKRSERLNGPFWHISSGHTVGGELCKSGKQAIAAVHGESKKGATAYAAMFEANADFIAAANPAAILALIDLARRAQPRVAEQADERVLPVGYFMRHPNGGDAGFSWKPDNPLFSEQWERIPVGPMSQAPAATTASASGLSDEQIVEALHKHGIDTYPSKYGFDALQVSATCIPNLRAVIEHCAALARAPLLDLTAEQIAAGAAVLGDDGKPIGRNVAIMVADAMRLGSEQAVDVARDAARWREALMHVGGAYCSEGARFTLRYLPAVPESDIMKGSIAEHFTAAIDRAAMSRTNTSGGSEE